jgi:hypothetical protein
LAELLLTAGVADLVIQLDQLVVTADQAAVLDNIQVWVDHMDTDQQLQTLHRAEQVTETQVDNTVVVLDHTAAVVVVVPAEVVKADHKVTAVLV